ncbi:MAG: hypothetical protein C0459_04565 [Chitinophaga sp.]|nr:hypothetical protein [Chitinophaga sp.]
MKIAIKIFRLFKGKERLKLVGLLIMLFSSGIFEALSIGLIFPFIAIATNKNIFNEFIQTHPLINKALVFLHIHNNEVLFFGMTLIFIFCLKLVTIIIITKKQYQIIYENQINVASWLLEHYLRQPYAFFIKNNSAHLIRNLTVDTSQVANGVLIGVLTFFSECFMLLGLFLILLWINPMVVILTVSTVSIVLSIIFSFTKRKLLQKGEQNRDLIAEMYKAINHAFGSIKDIKIQNTESFFIRQYKNPGNDYASFSSSIQTIMQIPRLFIELFLIAGIVIAVIILTAGSNGFATSSLPNIALFGTVAVRMMPSLNRIMSSLSGIKQNQAALENLVNEITAHERDNLINSKYIVEKFTDKLQLKNICFSYSDNNDNYLLKDFSLTISKGDCIGIVGESGSGKTTLVEILLGLHKTSNGEYYIDNTLIQPNISYNKLFGYVPQNIFLVDDSLNTNIILGREEKPEDTSRLLQNAIKQSELEELINSMSDSRKERVGERGVMLSGGQRQRIGIARALFNNPDILVFDEATASLDIETESKIIESISKLKGQKTIIMVAHRLQSLRFCNRIIALNKGKITFDGNFEDYMNNITDK